MRSVAKTPTGVGIRRIVRDRRAEASYISTLVGGVILMLFLALAINVFSLLSLRHSLSCICDEIMTEATAAGGGSDEVLERVSEIAAGYGIDPSTLTVSFDGSDLCPGSSWKVQLGDVVRLTVVCRTALAGSGVFDIPLSLTVSVSGISEVYWK